MLSIHQSVTPTYLRLLHTQEVRGSSPCAPTTPHSEINNLEPGNGLQQDNDPPLVDADGSHSESQMSPCGSQPFQSFKQFAGSELEPGIDIPTNNKVLVGLGAHGFLGEWPAGNSLVCRGSGSELRAGCASLHRSKWREGQACQPVPNEVLSITHHKGAVSPVAVKVRDRGMASGLSRDEWPDGTGGGSQELGGGSPVVSVKRSAAFNSDMRKGETPKAAALIESRAENRLVPASFRRAA